MGIEKVNKAIDAETMVVWIGCNKPTMQAVRRELKKGERMCFVYAAHEDINQIKRIPRSQNLKITAVVRASIRDVIDAHIRKYLSISSPDVAMFQSWLMTQGYMRISGGAWHKDGVVVSGKELNDRHKEWRNQQQHK